MDAEGDLAYDQFGGYEEQPVRDSRRSRLRRSRKNPVISRISRNQWLSKFVPGLVAGAILVIWLKADAIFKADTRMETQEETLARMFGGGADDVEEEVSEEGGEDGDIASRSMPITIVAGPNMKMALVVNDELSMKRGKAAAQVAHAAVGAYQVAVQAKQQAGLKAWEQQGQKKVALKITGAAELDRLQQDATKLGLPTYLVKDAGLTQIPSGSKTVLAVGPAQADLLDYVTGELKLY